MQPVFAIVIERLRELGMFQFFLPFLLTLSIFYALLRKSQLFGPPEANVVTNGVVATIAAFMVWSYPVLAGISIEKEFSVFMFQSTVAALVTLAGLLIASMFAPENFSKLLAEKLGAKIVIVVIIAIVFGGIGILFASGLAKVFLPPKVEVPADIITNILFLGLLFGSIIIIAWPRK